MGAVRGTASVGGARRTREMSEGITNNYGWMRNCRLGRSVRSRGGERAVGRAQPRVCSQGLI